MDRQKIAAVLALPAVAIGGELALFGAQALTHMYLSESCAKARFQSTFDAMPSFTTEMRALDEAAFWRKDAPAQEKTNVATFECMPRECPYRMTRE